ncbi:MAG: C15orf41 family protein [Thermoplasmata archaeon]
MKVEEHRYLVKKLNNVDDVHKVASELGYDPEQLMCILTQKITRDATKRFYQVKRQAKRLLWKFNMGKSLLELAKEVSFPPVLLAYLIFQENNTPRKEFWKNVREPEKIKDSRLRKEFKEISESDMMYSPKGNELMRIRGKKGEARLAAWLDAHGITYRTENDLKGKYPKTPDFLLDKPLKINGWTINWIESKANFGDEVEVKKNLKNQLEPYTRLFGPGLVVYWFDFVDAAAEILPPEVKIVSCDFFDKMLDSYDLHGKDAKGKSNIFKSAMPKTIPMKIHKHTESEKDVIPSTVRGLFPKNSKMVPDILVTNARTLETHKVGVKEPTKENGDTPIFTLSCYLAIKELPNSLTSNT